MQRYGMTVPFGGPLHLQRGQFEELETLGYTDAWSSEANGHDGLTPLALASQWAPTLRLGTAILPAYTRGPALMAQSIATLADAAPGRFVAGIGSSSNVIVERWNGIAFDEPFRKTRDMVRFLHSAFDSDKVSEDYDTFSIKGFRLGVRPEIKPKILVAALREGMLAMGASESDGVIVNWLTAQDTLRIRQVVDDASDGGERPEIVARIFVCPSEDHDEVVNQARFAAAAYLNVPVYRAFHEWMGRGDALGEHWEQWAAGDRSGALEKIPEAVIDALVINGSVDDCRAHIQRYCDNGIDTPALMVMPLAGIDARQAVRDLAPG
ncbi:MAG: LLM class F420-dependent oxidoreductase [Acidobacteria bacterium]|nr:LLM class F420-dependent oxidoreductase [Acidobacteriota bacterium]